MGKLLTLVGLIVVYSIAFPVLLCTSFILAWSSTTGSDYLLGSWFFEVVGAGVCGFIGVFLATRLNQVFKRLKN